MACCMYSMHSSSLPPFLGRQGSLIEPFMLLSARRMTSILSRHLGGTVSSDALARWIDLTV